MSYKILPAAPIIASFDLLPSSISTGMSFMKSSNLLMQFHVEITLVNLLSFRPFDDHLTVSKQRALGI